MKWTKDEVKKSQSVSHSAVSQLFVTPWTVARQSFLSTAILQARRLQWVAICFSRTAFQLRDQTWVSCIAGGFFPV